MSHRMDRRIRESVKQEKKNEIERERKTISSDLYNAGANHIVLCNCVTQI